MSDYQPIIYFGPDGSPNGTLAAEPGTIVLAADGTIYIKTTGSDEHGWTQLGA